ncbi:DUF1768-domain-containing protein [Mycena pura]|uniref:DUF1768-domain-containing protein n=1 Tax=Mycena pura TaxID=153505 RepID=A0AAD6US72_9AGAR|nr:DUF1768-domain-containing protein [Mycena pura]
MKSTDPRRTENRRQIFFHSRRIDQYHCFTNCTPHPVTYNGKVYPTSEHLFQAFKFMDSRPDIAEGIRTVSKSRMKAFEYSMAHIEHQDLDWNRMRIAKLEITTWHKFSQHPELRLKLLGTGDAELVVQPYMYHRTLPETTSGDKKGRNEFGKALERVRTSLRDT